MLHTAKITDTSAAQRPSQPPQNTSGTQGKLPGRGVDRTQKEPGAGALNV